MRVQGTFEVDLQPLEAPHSADGVTVGRMSIDKRFAGALSATSQGQMISARTPVAASAGYVAIERVSGTLDGKSGSFVLQHSGSVDRGAQSLTIRVVPDSGTGELAGLSGQMEIAITEGKHHYTFEYALHERQ